MAEVPKQEVGQQPVQTSQEQAPAQPEQTTGTENMLSWRALLPQELRDSENLKKFRNVAGLAKSYDELSRRMSTAVQIPGDGATPEELGRFFDRLGRPKDASGYVYEDTDLPEGVSIDGEFARRLREMAHANGFTPAQFKALVGFSGQVVQESSNLSGAQVEQQRIDGMKELQRRYGASAPRIQEEALAFFNMIGRGAFSTPEEGEAFMELVANNELSRNPTFIAVLSNAFRSMGDGDLLESELGDTVLMHKDTLQDEYDRLMQKKVSNPYAFTGEEQSRLNRIGEQIDGIENKRQTYRVA